MQKKPKELPQKIRAFEQRIEGLRADLHHVQEATAPNENGFPPMTINGTTYTEKKDAGTALLEVCKSMTSPDPILIGQYRGFSMELYFDSITREFKVVLANKLRHTVPLGTDIFGNIQRLDNLFDSLPEKQKNCEDQLENAKNQLATAKVDVQKPFAYEEEFKSKSERLAELNALLDIDKPENEIVDDERSDEEEEPAKAQEEPER